ncbi:hypothetical protein T02_1879, partial [Trichinella nativa]
LMAYKFGILPLLIHGYAYNFFQNIPRNTRPGTAASAERSFTAVKYLKSYFWTTMTEERLNGLAVIEAVERKCIYGGYWKIVSVNQVDVFVGLMGECEAWQKIISVSLVAYPTYVSRCLTLRAQCLAFMQIRPLEY